MDYEVTLRFRNEVVKEGFLKSVILQKGESVTLPANGHLVEIVVSAPGRATRRAKADK